MQGPKAAMQNFRYLGSPFLGLQLRCCGCGICCSICKTHTCTGRETMSVRVAGCTSVTEVCRQDACLKVQQAGPIPVLISTSTIDSRRSCLSSLLPM